MKEKKGMIDNKKVNNSHQEGISRVLQRGNSDKGAQNGKMSMKGDGKESNWKRSGASLTPRRA